MCSSHMDLMPYERLNLGILSTAYNQIFQNAIRETLEGTYGAINVSDDFLVCSEFLQINSSNM